MKPSETAARVFPRDSDEEFRRKWEPIFRAAREGRLPNRLREVLEVSQQLHENGYHWKDRPTIEEARAWLAKHPKPKTFRET